MRRVILESPYAGSLIQRWLNRRYARKCLRHSLAKGEAPLASHLLYAQALEDTHSERMTGIMAGFTWAPVAQAAVVYIDRGVSPGMEEAIKFHYANGLPVEYRSILASTTIIKGDTYGKVKAKATQSKSQKDYGAIECGQNPLTDGTR